MTVSKTIKPMRAPIPGKALDTSAINPLGEVFEQELSPVGFCPQDILANSAEYVPAWQRDVGEKPGATPAAFIERRAILSALTKTGRFGVILDQEGAVTQGTLGWTQHIGAIPTLTIKQNRLAPTSPQSQQELVAALGLLFSDYNWPSVPVALRDLDGWVTDIIHLKRVGVSNPERAYVVLPKSLIDVEKTLSTLAIALGLTPLETTLVRLIVKGETEREMAGALDIKSSDIKRGIRQLVFKFRVRQKSDIGRLIASIP
jgi:DNA-binding CsgD family transcriptional regulator